MSVTLLFTMAFGAHWGLCFVWEVYLCLSHEMNFIQVQHFIMTNLIQHALKHSLHQHPRRYVGDTICFLLIRVPRAILQGEVPLIGQTHPFCVFWFKDSDQDWQGFSVRNVLSSNIWFVHTYDIVILHVYLMIVITYLRWTWDWWYSGYSGYFLHNFTIQLDNRLCRSCFQRHQKLRWVAHLKLHASRCIDWIESFVQCLSAEHGMTIAVQLLHFVINIFLPIRYQFQLLCKVSMWLLFDTACIVDLWLCWLLPFVPRTMLGDVLHRIITL
jgi:hypothetical protein